MATETVSILSHTSLWRHAVLTTSALLLPNPGIATVLVPSNTNPLPAAVVVAPTAAVVATVLAPTNPPFPLVACAPPAPTNTPSLTVPAVMTWLIVPLHAAPTRQQATWPA